MTGPLRGAGARLHSLDALRGFALLLGIVFHATLAYRLAPGVWAVGTTTPSVPLMWFDYYAHSFRMEVFFLLAGFFAGLVVARRGIAAFLRDRARRILLVFVVALYPMKYLLTCAWIAGGLKTGWLNDLPSQVASLPVWHIAILGLQRESWPDIPLTHLWFLYYLAIITALFLAARWLGLKLLARAAHGLQGLDGAYRRVMSSPLAPIWMALAVTPALAAMSGLDVDTPDKSLAWRFPVLALYGIFFCAGWWLHRQLDLLEVLARRWSVLLCAGLLVSALAFGGLWIRYDTPLQTDLRWATSFTSSLTMTLSVLGWLGLFVKFFERPSHRLRYLADASYWLYLAHLPVVVALQIWLSGWDAHWTIKLLIINVLTFAGLLALYHGCVRYTWLGTWLNGPRAPAPALVAEQA